MRNLEDDAMGTGGVTEHERLAVLLGTWKTEGWTRALPDAPAARIDAVDTYEWLPGGFGLLHVVDAKVGETKVEGAEIIGYDAERHAYVTQYVGSEGSTSYEASLTDDQGLVWRMRSATTKFTGTFSDDRAMITGYWELLADDGDWQRWMDITLTKQRG